MVVQGTRSLTTRVHTPPFLLQTIRMIGDLKGPKNYKKDFEPSYIKMH
jgi:hypothetical protein